MSYLGYFNALISNNGVPITATVTVYLTGTETKATIYSTPGGTLKDNPFQTDVLGRFQFFAAVGDYDIEVSGAGVTTYKIENVHLSDVTKSTQLTDMPASLTGGAGKMPKVNVGETAYELVETAAGWIAPTLLNSWVNFGSGYNPTGYYKDALGVVHLRGMLKDGSFSVPMFTLSAGYRPAYTEIFIAISGGAVGYVNVGPDGQVTPVAGSASFFALDGMTFHVA